MEELNWSYLAGFIDADGTISIRKNDKAGKSYRPYVSIANTNRDVLELFKYQLGRGAICTKKAKKENHSESYEVRWDHNVALFICEHCYPYLTIKKARAELLLSDWKLYTPRNGKYTDTLWRKKLDLVRNMRILNSRGSNNTCHSS